MWTGRIDRMPSADVVITRFEGERYADELGALYRHLHEHQVEAAPKLGPHVPRSAEESGDARRASYVEWLRGEGAFVLIARRGAERVGYALVTIAGAYCGWQSAATVGELRDIVVAPDMRGQGVGSQLLDGV